MTGPLPEPGSSSPALASYVFRHYAADLHRFLRKRLRDPHRADDVAQEVFSRLVRVQQPELVKKPHSYLFGIAFHVIREMRLQDEHEPVDYDSQAVEQAAEHPAEVVRDEMETVPFYVPVNEISFWAWAGGSLGYINPLAEGRGNELKAILVQAAIAAIESLRSVDAGARIVHAEPAIKVIPR